MRAYPLITGMGCLTPAGHSPQGLLAAMAGPFTGVGPVSTNAVRPPDALAGIIESLDGLDKAHAPAGQRRRMNRLSRMSCAAVGLALSHAGLEGDQREKTGLILATAFGGTGQCALFFGGLLDDGERLVNPAHFPETVPSAPSGQAGVCFGLKGPSTTVCQQSLSSEYALLIAERMILSGMAERLVVLGAEEMCPALLDGFKAMGVLKLPGEMTPDGVRLSPRIVPGEAAVALVVEDADAALARGARPLAELLRVEAGGRALASARFGRTGREAAEAARRACDGHGQPGLVVASGSFCSPADIGQWDALGRLFGPETLATTPEYATGHLFGAGLIRVLVAACALSGLETPCAPLSRRLPETITPATLFTRTCRFPDLALTCSASPGGGAGAVLLGRA